MKAAQAVDIESVNLARSADINFKVLACINSKF